MNWDALESPLGADLSCFIEPRDRDPASELDRVKRFRALMSKRAPLCRVVAIPNAAARGMKGLNQARSEGAKWGFPDLMVLHAGRVAFLEFKNGKDKPKAHQVDWLNWLEAAGFPCGVFRTGEAAIRWLHERRFPVEVARGA